MANVGGIRAGRAYVELYADASKLQRSLKAAESRLKSFGDSASSIGAQFMGLGVAASLPIAAAVRGFAAFDDQMRVVQAVSGSTAEEFAMLTERAKELGRTTSFTAAEVANAMAELGRAGFKAPQIDAAIDSVMNLSRATQTEIPLATEIAGNALRAFDLDASEMGRVCDVMTATANNSAQTLEDLGEAFKFVAPIAADAGLSIEDASKIVGTLANFGIKGSLAGTAFKNIQLKMADPKVQASYKELGVEVLNADDSLRNMADVLRDLGAATASMPNAEKLATYQKLFSMYGLSGGIKLTSANFTEMYDAIDNAQGVAAETAATMDSGIGGAFRQTQSAVEGVAHAIGEALTPKITELAGTLIQVAGETTAWIKENEDTVETVASVAAGVALFGGSLLAVGTAAKVAASTTTGLRAAWSANLAIANALTGATRKAEAAQRAESAAKEAAAVVEQKQAALDRANLVMSERATLALQAEAKARQAATAAQTAGIATDAESAQIMRLKAEITTRETALRDANARAIQAQTAAQKAAVATSVEAAELQSLLAQKAAQEIALREASARAIQAEAAAKAGGIATAREEAKIRALETQRATQEIALRAASTKARLAESAAERAQAAVKSAVASKADAATVKALKAEAAKRAAVAQTAQAELKAAQNSIDATNRRIAATQKEIAARAKATQVQAQADVKEAQSALASTEKKIAAKNREIAKRAKADQAKARADLKAAQDDAKSAQSAIASAEKKIAAIQREISARDAAAQKALHAAQAEAAEARAKLATADASANAARAELADANATLANANSKVRGAASARAFAGALRGVVASIGPLLAFSAVTAAVTAFANASQRAAEKAREASDAAAETARANQEQRDSHKELFDRLVELASQQTLTNAQFVEGKSIVERLTGVYGDLGITLDETAKKFGGLAEAQAAFNQKQREQKKADLASEDAALQQELESLARQRENLVGENLTVGGYWAGLKDVLGMEGGTQDKLDAIAKREGEVMRRRNAIFQEKQGLEQEEKVEEAAKEERKKAEASSLVREEEEARTKRVEEATETAATFENDNLSTDAERRKREINKKYDEYVAAQATLRDEKIAQTGDGAGAFGEYAANIAKADAWKTAELNKVRADESTRKWDEEATARQNERSRRDATADAKVAEARLAVFQAMSGGGNVSAAMEAFKSAEAERETSRRENAQTDAESAMKRFANAQAELEKARKSGDKSRIEAAEEESANAAQELTSANSTLDEIIRGSYETAQKMQPQLSSQGTFNAWEAGNFAQASPELEEMKRQTDILDRIERKFVFTGDDTRL
ncbi:MAG: phage tail tape measure protein [Thermoguttaceae bacterium]|nr:phage tail tape measure protein [Thermoguttaceae bacterium]